MAAYIYYKQQKEYSPIKINNMISQFQQNLRKFKNRLPFLLISVQIDDQQYQLQVNQKNTIKDVVERYQRSGHLSNECGQRVYFNGNCVDGSRTISEMIKDMNEQKMNQLLIKIEQLPKKNQIIEKQPKHKSQQPLKQPQLPSLPNIKKQPIKTDKQYTSAERIQRADKITKWLNEIIKNNSCQLEISKNEKEEEKNIFNLIKIIQKQIIIKQAKQKVCQQFVNVLAQKLEKLKGNEDVNGFRKKKSGKNVGSQISMFGDKQDNILQTVQTLLCYISAHKSTLNQQKLQQLKMQETSQAQIKQIEYLKKERIELEQKIKKQKQQSQKLKQQQYKLKQQNQQLKYQIDILEQQRQKLEFKKLNKSLGITTIDSTTVQNTTLYNFNFNSNSNCNFNSNVLNQIKLITYYVNVRKKSYHDQFGFILGCLQRYQGQLVDTIQPLATFTNNLYFDSLPLLFDTLDLNSPNTRLIIILQTSNAQFLAFYSTNGVSKMVKQSPPASPMKSKSSKSEQKVTSQPCKSGLGFLLQLNSKKQFSLPENQDMKSLMWYDQKFVYITQSLKIYKNLNKKLQLQLRPAQVQQIWGQDMGNKLVEELSKLKKGSEIKRMQVLKVNLSNTQTYKGEDASQQMFHMNKVQGNFLFQKM